MSSFGRYIHNRNISKFTNPVFTLQILYSVYQIHLVAREFRLQDPALWYVTAFWKSYWAGQDLAAIFMGVGSWFWLLNLGRGPIGPEEPFFFYLVAPIRHDPSKSPHTPLWTEWIVKNVWGLFNVICLASFLFLPVIFQTSCRYQEGISLIPKWTDTYKNDQCRERKIWLWAIGFFYAAFHISVIVKIIVAYWPRKDQRNLKDNVMFEMGCEKDVNEKGEKELESIMNH
ncbi:hypothetical protein N7509_004638 [Penicillium cosmopolitanum]|uniref:Uncharacterized protein n=1 Tax=Penicillium cosmopolitanum TaxID=1131564 RepID=A0A9X0B997_9EURO|nr:uncharacterized protein N7509_004638 [Penicillium cosmopolitanum]KAJ5396525.1 hypothetical protein N7509_004638 [Penicillium cosmopolitanum]